MLNGFLENTGEIINFYYRMRSFLKIAFYSFAILFVFEMAFVSCKSSYVFLNIENSKPAPNELPDDIQSITILNRSMNNQFLNHNEDSLQIYFYRKGYQLSTYVLDSLAADTTIQALAQLLFESGRYDVVVPLARNIHRKISYNLVPDTLSPDTVRKICHDYNTDALLVMEKFTTKAMADYTSEVNKDAYNSTAYYASLDLKYEAVFRLYKPEQKSFLKSIRLADTIYWESADYSQERLFRNLPTIKKALISSGIKVALDMDNQLSPNWVSEKRGYFLLKKKNDEGQKYMQENNLSEAAKYWTLMSQSTKNKTRAKAEYNMALINELNGDLDKAIEWGLKSFYSDYMVRTEIYLKKLSDRKKTLQKTD